jgi:hypothetical protein
MRQKPPWYRESHQIAWLLASAVAFALGLVVLRAWRQGRMLQANYRASSIAVAGDSDLNSKLVSDSRGFEELIDRGSSQREQLIGEINDFEKQVELLKSRTKGLELVKADLEKLDAEFAGYRRIESQFKSDLRRLDVGQPVQ